MFLALRIVLIVVGCVSVAGAQTITLRLVNGGNGKPIGNQNVAVNWDDNSLHDIQVRVDRKGRAVMAIPAGAKHVTLAVGDRKGKEPMRISYADCNQTPVLDVPVADIAQHGFVSASLCSTKLRISVNPGEVVFLGQPLPWWKPDMQ